MPSLNPFISAESVSHQPLSDPPGSEGLASLPLLRLLQLASPALPVGAYTYSEGLEWLVHRGHIGSAADLRLWLVQDLRRGSVRLDGALMQRAFVAWELGQEEQVLAWNRWLHASRDTEELRNQSLQMGRSLLKLGQDLHPDVGQDVGQDVRPDLDQDLRQSWQPLGLSPETLAELLQPPGCHFAIAFGIVAASWGIPLPQARLGYLQSWLTNLVNAGIKLIPLGQTAGQRLLRDLESEIVTASAAIATLSDRDLVSCGWGLSLASMAHETLYSRLFRS